MIRLVIYEIETLMPHGEPLRKYHTVEIDCPEVEELLTEHAATVVGAEVVNCEAARAALQPKAEQEQEK
jgi:hypothetical protein